MRRVAVYAGTRRVYRDMMCAAKSLVKHTRMDAVYFLIEDDSFPWPVPEVVTLINAKKDTWAKYMETGPNVAALSHMSLLRLIVPEMLRQEIRALWLDVDTIVEKDIGPLFDIALGENVVAMVEEPVRSKYPFRYYNAGVLLMNMEKLRDTWLSAEMADRVKREAFTAAEQDVLNLYCQAKTLTLGPEWNMAEHITQHNDDPYIRHFAGCLKPRGRAIFDAYETEEWSVKNAE